MQLSQDGLRAFDASGYEIFAEAFAETGEVVIWSRAPGAPRVGERFNIERHGVVHDLVVSVVRTFAGGWTVTCRAG